MRLKDWLWQPIPAPTGEKESWPRITVVTPSFNQGRYLEEAIRSVLLQAYPNLEYLVLDGGSTDGSQAIIAKHEGALAGWRSHPDQGQAAALVEGFERATGDVLAWLNSDDLLLPGTLHRVGAHFRVRESSSFFYGNRLVIDEETTVIGRHIWPRYISRYHWYEGQPLAQECCFWRRELYLEVGGIDPSKFFIMDYDLFYRMWRRSRFHKTSAVIGAIRQHPETKNSTHSDVRDAELATARQGYGLRPAGYVARRVINRLDRLQRRIDELQLRHEPTFK